MLEQIRKQVISDLLFWPWSLTPVVLGVTGVIGAWANDGPIMLFFGGVGAIVLGVGAAITRLFVFSDQLGQKAWADLQEKQRKDKQKELLDLHEKLEEEHDARTTHALRDLIAVYDTFQKRVVNGDLSIPAKSSLKEKVDLLFQGCLKELVAQHDLWTSQKNMSPGRSKNNLKTQRDSQIVEIQQSIESMSKTIEECLSLTGGTEDDLTQRRKEMETQMRVTKATDARMQELGLKEKA